MTTETATSSLKKESKKSKILKLALKVAVTVLCFIYVFRKVDIHSALKTLQTANVFYLIAGLTLYFISKIVASIRLNVYFRNIHIKLSQTTNFKLYLLGLFYNLFLPGSIGGDAYKVVLLKRHLNSPYRKTSLAVLIDRFSGLLGLGLMLCFFGSLVLTNKTLVVLLPAALLMTIALSYFATRQWASDFLSGFWPTFFWGLLVQVFANASALAIILSLGINTHLSEYMFIFLVASVAAVLPLTLGGLGAREIVFYQLSAYFGLDVHSSVLIGLIFYLVTVVTSAAGLPYVFKNPLASSNTPV